MQNQLHCLAGVHVGVAVGGAIDLRGIDLGAQEHVGRDQLVQGILQRAGPAAVGL